ncbi:MAG: hypothetical protein K0U68_13700 [Gammaproteobacteria bacterium]|nr:hypothetical protein [Gammaproteobacteria bacterium]
MTPQSHFMIVATIRDNQVQYLRDFLATMTSSPVNADPDNSLVPFGQFERIHVARFMIIESDILDEIREFGVTPRPWRPALVFLGDIDGDRISFLAELTERAGSGLRQIFAYCEDFDDDTCDLLSWMTSHNVKPQANYINWLGRTVKQVREEAALHDNLSLWLQDNVESIGRDNTRQLRQALLSHVEMEKHAGRLTLSPPEPTPFDWKIRNVLHLVGVPLFLLLLTPFFLIIAPFFALKLRFLERSDPELFIRPSREHIDGLAAQEDWYLSNQFNVFGDIKPGLFRLLLYKLIMLITDYAARHVFNRGFLSRIKTIHFARWVFLDNNHRAFFASNYDGSHESYMDDFINKVGWGLNLTFSNSVGYPTTTWLIKQGAYREMQFKYTQRRHQVRSEVWYKAYPDLTVTDLIRNTRIRQGVEVRQSSDAEIRDWLSLI